MDWGSLGDSGHAGAEAKDRSPRCTTTAEAPSGRPLSPNLGGELGKSRSATTPVASASFGADAHTNHKSVASRSSERRSAAKEAAVGSGGTSPVGVVRVGSVGQPSATRTAGRIRPTDPGHPTVKCRCGTGSEQAAGSAAAHDASGGGVADGTGLRVDRGDTATICLWQADRELGGIGAHGRIQRRSSTARSHQQTGEFSVAVLAGGSGAGHGAERPGLAAKVSALSDASRKGNREGGDGSQACGPSLLDVAEGMGLRASEEVRFARGTARKSSGCAVDHRDNGWVELNWARDDYKASLGLVWRVVQQNKMMRSRSAGRTTSKQSLTQPTLLERGFIDIYRSSPA